MARRATKDKPMVTRIALTKARANLGALIRRVHVGKEYFVLEKDGLPVAALMDIDEFEDYLELQNHEVQKIIAESRKEYLEGKGFPAEDLVDELRAEAQKGKRRVKPERV